MQHYIQLIIILVCFTGFENARKLNIEVNEKVRVFSLKEVGEEKEDEKNRAIVLNNFYYNII